MIELAIPYILSQLEAHYNVQKENENNNSKGKTLSYEIFKNGWFSFHSLIKSKKFIKLETNRKQNQDII